MEEREAHLRALTAPLAQAREGEPRPVVRFSVEAVAHAFPGLLGVTRDHGDAPLLAQPGASETIAAPFSRN
jgi:hypothetical protein